jgi:hypothetical protein
MAMKKKTKKPMIKVSQAIRFPKANELRFSRWLRSVLNTFWKSTNAVLLDLLSKPRVLKIPKVYDNIVDVFLTKISYDILNKVAEDSLKKTLDNFDKKIPSTSMVDRLVSFETGTREKLRDTLEAEWDKRKQQLDDFRASALFNSENKDKLFEAKYTKPKYKFTDTWSRTEINNLNRDLTLAEAQSIGVTQCKWQTSGDERVRDSHRKLEGKVFDIKNLPKEYNDYNCRCVLIPLV